MNLSSTSSSKSDGLAIVVAMAIILVSECLLYYAPTPNQLMPGSPNLGSFVNLSADLDMIHPNTNELVFIGDSTGKYGIDVTIVESILNIPCGNNSRSNHFSIWGLQQVIDQYLQNHRQCRTVVVPLQYMLLTVDLTYVKKHKILGQWLQTHGLTHEDYRTPLPFVPSRKFAGLVHRTLFWDPQRVYFGKHDYEGWMNQLKLWRGSIQDHRLGKMTDAYFTENYGKDSNPQFVKEFNELVSWATSNNINLFFVFTPIPESARNWRTINRSSSLRSQFKIFEKVVPKASRLNEPWLYWDDSYYCDTVHLNTNGQKLFSNYVADLLKARLK